MVKLLFTNCPFHTFSFLFFHHSFSYWYGCHLFTRLRKELELHKEGELELLREALTSEIHFLKSVSFCVMNKAFILANKNYFRWDTAIHILPESDRIVCMSDQGRKIISFKYSCGVAHCDSFSKCSFWVLCRSSFSFSFFCISRSWTAVREVSSIRFGTMMIQEGYIGSLIVSSVKKTFWWIDERKGKERRQQTEWDYEVCVL